ncbi:MAG: NAD(P)H-hydrate dehydratase [Bacteroidales bacterium]|nr:NAD(P)H-hydrate dehydratase [Bacteroidales bacterium]
MKVFLTSQVRDIDRLTIEKEPISPINLMERAADALFRWFACNISAVNTIAIFAGPGNNGGDGLALARMLIDSGYIVEVYTFESANNSPDYLINLARLKNQKIVTPIVIKDKSNFPKINSNTIIVDALFGSGLARPLSGLTSELIDYLNDSRAQIISVDIPSGLFGDENPFPNINPAIKASITLTLQFPKISFFFAENARYVGEWKILPIGLNVDAIESLTTLYSYIDQAMVSSILKPRTRFDHKGTFGHCLIIAGSYGMMGTSVLSSTACLTSGSGLVTAHVPKIGYPILQQSIPEVMIEVDENDHHFSIIGSISKYSAIGIGPGIGKDRITVNGLKNLLENVKAPLLIDADGLNILADNPEFIRLLPENTVITPHPGEFDRLFGKSTSGFQRLKMALDKAKENRIIIVLKGAYTQIVCPDGNIYFNSTGNPGIATAGSGDVLTGVITSLLGQGYNPVSSSIIGVYIHGLAGDLAIEKKRVNALIASDIISYLGKAFQLTEKSKND